MPASAQQRPEKEFSAPTASGALHDANSPTRPAKGQANTGSFDFVSGLASESTHSAQDDRVGEIRDIDIFRPFVKAGQRLAEIHVHCEQQPEYPLTKTEKAGEKLDYRVKKMKLSKYKTSP